VIHKDASAPSTKSPLTDTREKSDEVEVVEVRLMEPKYGVSEHVILKREKHIESILEREF